MSAAEIRTEAEFFAMLYAMESAAAERYGDLAGQMEMHNNRPTADLFRRLAEIELRHAREVRERAAALGCTLDAQPRVLDLGGIELTAFEEAHYLMTPHHALTLALENEEQAAAFFADLARSAPSERLRELAAEARDEELRHASRLRAWLADHPAPSQNWADDPDPPVYSE
jgi:rubrerythrin